MGRLPRWLKVAVPAAVVLIAIGVIAVVAAADNHDDDAASPRASEASSTTRAPAPTTTHATTTSSTLVPDTEPAPPIGAPPTDDSPPSTGTLTARIELASRTIPAGSRESGTVIVENTGADLQVETCGDYFTVVLTSASVQYPDPTPNQCVTTMTIPAGTSSYPVTISTFYASCDEIQGNEFPACDANGPPPLPAGEYRTLLFEASTPPVAISVDPVVVNVV